MAGCGFLFAAAFGDPGEEAAHARAFGPQEMEEFTSVEVRSGGTEEGFHAPANIGAFPGIEPITFRSDPVVAKGV